MSKPEGSENLQSLRDEYDTRAGAIYRRIHKMHQAIGDYLAAEMAQLGVWFQDELAASETIHKN